MNEDRPFYYILDSETGEPKPERDILAFALWFETAQRRLREHCIGDVHISTIFLGIDHASRGDPVLWETMIFGGEHDLYQDRYTSRKEAIEGHERALALVRASLATFSREK